MFYCGRIGGISNNITKIWNSGEITEEKKKAIRWLCMETNFSIDYAKTLFKPKRPDDVDKILKKLCNNKVPFFFQFAKNKKSTQCEDYVYPLNTINKICKEIHINRLMFKGISELAPFDYTLLLSQRNEEHYINEEINREFIKWTRQYGYTITIDDDNTCKNNYSVIAREVKKDLNRLEKDQDKIIDSLVEFMYAKPNTHRKKLLWITYGKQLYQNLVNNMGENYPPFCWKCGKRSNDKVIDGLCSDCRNGTITKVCVDCGASFTVKVNNKNCIRCPDCQLKHTRRLTKLRVKKHRKKM